MSPRKSRYNYLHKAPEDHLPLSVLCLRRWSRTGGWNCRAIEGEKRTASTDDPLWHLQRCARSLWVTYGRGGESRLQGHDSISGYFKSFLIILIMSSRAFRGIENAWCRERPDYPNQDAFIQRAFGNETPGCSGVGKVKMKRLRIDPLTSFSTLP